MGKDKRKIDWDNIEVEYAKNIRSNCDLSREFLVSETAIRKRAKQFGWVRDLSAKIKLKADLKVRVIEFESHGSSSINKHKERDIIEAEATTQAMILVAQRADTNKYRTLCVALYSELSAQTLDKESFEKLGELMRNPNQNGTDKLNDLYKRIIDTPSRIDAFKKLSETFKTIVGLERQAYNISDNANNEANTLDVKSTPAGDFLNDMIKRIGAAH